MKPIRFNSELKEIEKINEEVWIMKFSVPQDFTFEAGQFVLMAFYKDGKRILREYTIFSSPDEKGFIDIYLKKVEGGFASTKLFSMKIGDKIEMKGPTGFFTLKNDSQNKEIIFVSSGTGFAPFGSILRYLKEKGFRNKIKLIRGFRKEEDLVLEDYLQELQKNEENFEYVNIFSKPSDESYELKGHVQDFLEKFVSKDFEGEVYVCGLKEMALETREKLMEMGLKKEQILLERYD